MGTFPNKRVTCLLLIRIDFWQLLILVHLLPTGDTISCIVELSFSGQLILPYRKKCDCLQEAKCNIWIKPLVTFCRRKLWWNTSFYQSRKNSQAYICSNQAFNEKTLGLKHIQKVVMLAFSVSLHISQIPTHQHIECDWHMYSLTDFQFYMTRKINKQTLFIIIVWHYILWKRK